MSTPYSNGNPFPPPRRTGAQQTSKPQGRGAGGGGGKSYHFHYNPGTGTGGGSGRGNTGGAQASGIGQPSGGGQGANAGPYSPLGDLEFFTNADVRNFAERGRTLFMKCSFDLSMAHEILQAVLKEVPDPDGTPFGSSARARRVAKHLKKAADDAKNCAAELARTYAAFQREYDPEISRVAKPRQPRRKFDFGG